MTTRGKENRFYLHAAAVEAVWRDDVAKEDILWERRLAGKKKLVEHVWERSELAGKFRCPERSCPAKSKHGQAKVK